MEPLHKHLRSAINLAKNYAYDESLSYRHAAVIFKGGSILSVGYNGLNKNSFVDHLVKKLGVKEGHTPTLHAEVAAILAVRDTIDLNGAKIAVARIKPTGIGMSAPCYLCQDALKRYGIKRAMYTISDNSYGIMKL